MQIYLNKSQIFALLMMIDDAEAMLTGTADGWAGLLTSNPDLHDEISEAVYNLKQKLENKGYTYEEMVRPNI
ncbi:hypothetical protein [Paenibacillus medicaginis]|uniref:Uncharacterized protein n=1 Tax=Paenibacillus medicaginis TaxID=1470560 RepID=A0ABV5BUQ7_9BACL